MPAFFEHAFDVFFHRPKFGANHIADDCIEASIVLECVQKAENCPRIFAVILLKIFRNARQC